MLPQRETGRICGWYNARVAALVKKAAPRHRLLPAPVAPERPAGGAAEPPARRSAGG